VKIWTVHERAGASPMLVRDGFSFGALLFGPFWLAAHRAWLPAAAAILLILAIPLLSGPPASTIFVLGFAMLLGFSGWDLVRWSVTRRRYLESNIVSGKNEDDAFDRLLTARPDLVDRTMVAETAP
jgi:hypothetical protein